MTGQTQYAVPDYASWRLCPDWLKELYETSPPRWCPFPSGRPTLLDVYEDVAQLLGGPLRRWQKLAALIATEQEEIGTSGQFRPRYSNVLITVPRQLGKSWFETVGMFVDLVTMQRGDDSLLIAQSGTAAKDAIFNKWLRKIDETDLWKLLDVKSDKSNAPYLLSQARGTRVAIHAGSEKSGHGGTFITVRLDEVWALDEKIIETSVGAATRAVLRHQRIGVSTVGEEDSDLLNNQIYRGREELKSGIESRHALVEWSGDEKRDPGDQEVWVQATPALDEISADGIGVTLEQIEEEYVDDRTDGKVYFRRKALNQIGEATINTAINLTSYNRSCVDSVSEFNSPEPFPLGRYAIGVDATLEGEWASIAMVDETGRVAVLNHQTGIDWMVKKLREAHSNPEAPTPKLIGAQMGTVLETELDKIESIRGVTVRRFNHAERAGLCVQFRDRVHGATREGETVSGFRIFDYPALRAAVFEAARPADDSRALYRFLPAKHSTVLSPLYAAVFAEGALQELLLKPRPTSGRFRQGERNTEA